MACNRDRLWHAAVVVDLLDDCQVKVSWDRKEEIETLAMEKIWPMGWHSIMFNILPKIFTFKAVAKSKY